MAGGAARSERRGLLDHGRGVNGMVCGPGSTAGVSGEPCAWRRSMVVLAAVCSWDVAG